MSSSVVSSAASFFLPLGRHLRKGAVRQLLHPVLERADVVDEGPEPLQQPIVRATEYAGEDIRHRNAVLFLQGGERSS
jgi:hypothetical protein